MATSRLCSIPGCGKAACNSRGWCNAHYIRWRKFGDPLGAKPGPVDLSGSRFGRWTVIREASVDTGRKRSWVCICDCGADGTVTTNDLKSGHSISCGCHRREALLAANSKHGHVSRRQGKSRTYNAWQNMKKRCLSPDSEAYVNYGERGITICVRWLESFEAFLADMGECPPRLTIERINNDGNYEPGNCIWATRKVQNRNSRHNLSVNLGDGRGEMPLSAQCEELDLPYNTIKMRILRGWSVGDAFSIPVSDGWSARRQYQGRTP